MPKRKRESLLKKLSTRELAHLQYHWPFWARPNQQPPADTSWINWLYLGGRGVGKTRAGAEWFRSKAETTPNGNGALIGNTPGDVRDVMIQGDSGILAVCPPWNKPEYEPSKLQIRWRNGFVANIRSANNPETVRGLNTDVAWCDELAAWPVDSGRMAWDNLMFALRRGENPQNIVTTTPKPIPLIKELMEDPDTVVTRGSTYENIDNLAPNFVKSILGKYEGTSLGRQEIYAEILDEVEGALWNRELINKNRVKDFPELTRVVVGVDPSGGVAEVGIVCAGIGEDDTVYVLSDASLRGTPDTWANAVVTEYNRYEADRIVAEVNYGGQMVESTIRTASRDAAFKAVTATRGKLIRAEPVAALYEQGRVKHVGTFDAMESEMTSWVPGEKSPNRLDALVWAITELALGTGRRKGDPLVY